LTRTVIASILVSIVLVLATFIVVVNWASTIQTNLNHMRGIKRNHSMVPVVAQFLVLIAGGIEWLSGAILPASIFWVIALSDLAFWCLLYLPVYLLRERRRLRTTSGDNGTTPLS